MKNMEKAEALYAAGEISKAYSLLSGAADEMLQEMSGLNLIGRMVTPYSMPAELVGFNMSFQMIEEEEDIDFAYERMKSLYMDLLELRREKGIG